ncbi:MAG TPA: SGNH/GDSL hydrolase family protein [Candidatus Dojkabacteria bacterium]|nr:SGNH/GDSL hydrolase family protein [Candidatus Dojkabacteria bacterium]
MTNYLDKFQSKQPLNVVCIGDSTTSQEWCHPNWIDWINFKFKQSDDYPAGVNRQIINSGYDGQNIGFFLDNFEKTISKFQPDLVILSLGFNHLENLENFEEETIRLIKRIKELGSEIAIWSTYETINPKYSSSLKQASRIYSKIAEQERCLFIDIYSEFRKYHLEKLFTFVHQWENTEWEMEPGEIDFLHCNEIGNQIIAEKVLREIFNTDLDFAKEWISEKGQMGTMIPLDTSKYLL